MTDPQTLLTISFFGAQAVGKTTICNVLEKHDSSITRLDLDRCMKSKSPQESVLSFLSSDFIDWDLVERFLSQKVGTTIELPVLDFNIYTRVSETGGDKSKRGRIMLLDGLFPYAKADFKVGLRLESGERKRRLTDRHFNERKQCDKVLFDCCMANWDRMIDPVADNEDLCDLILDGAESTDVLVEKVLGLFSDNLEPKEKDR